MTLWQAVVAALVAGALAAPHCFAMCGPLALAGCAQRRDGIGYYLGRSVAYAATGAVIGHLGQRALSIVPVAALQTAAALALALFCVWRGAALMRPRASAGSLVALRTGPSLLPWPTRGVGLGMLTAVLPCGALVAAWLIAASTFDATAGAAAMLSFSIASAPGTLAALLGRRAFAKQLSKLPRTVFAAAWFLAAVVVIGRIWLSGHSHCH